MRIGDLLFEAGLKVSDFTVKNNHYWQNLLALIEKGEEIELTSGEKVHFQDPKQVAADLAAIWDGNSLATPEQVKEIKSLKIPAADGTIVTIGKIFKSAQIKTGSGATSDEEALAKFWNLGNVVEGVMGAAVTAKFLNPDRDVVWKDIVAVLRELVGGTPPAPEKGKKPSKLVPYSMSAKARNDDLSFVMSLNALDFKALQMSYLETDTLKKYPEHQEIFKAYTDAAEYVNTSDTVKTAIQRVQKDPNENKIIVESEGASHEKQTSTKADLFITIDGARERLLSLKSKVVPQVGQVSGHAFENLEEFFKSTLGFGLPNSFAKMFPKGAFKDVGPQIFQTAFPAAYKHMFGALSKTLSGDSEYKEYDFVKQIYTAVQHHATLGEDVIIVYLSPSAKRSYTEIKIGPELLDALKEFDLVPVLSGPTTIKVIGRPVTELGKQITGGQEQEFVQLRSYMQKGSTVRNIVEIKSLLKSLADVENIKTREIVKQKIQPDELSTVRKNAGLAQPATAPKPALKVSQQKMASPPATNNVKQTVGAIGSK